MTAEKTGDGQATGGETGRAAEGAGEGATRLADGSRPASPQELFELLDRLEISTRTVEHPPVYTVEEAKALRGELPGAHTKNLFLRNKKGRMWLVTCLEDRDVDLKALAGALDAGRFSFGSAERLMTYLGVEPGSVTPFGVINDRTGEVTMVLDSTLASISPLNFHPLVNTMTTSITPEGLMRFFEEVGHPPQLLDMDALEKGAAG